MIRPALLLSALFFSLPVAAQQVYSWKDKDGRIHYSDVPPPEGATKTLSGPSRPPTAVTTEPAEADAASAPPAVQKGPRTAADQELEFRQRRAAEAEAQAKAEKEKSEAAAQEKKCNQARAHLAALESGQRVSRLNDKGEREYLDDKTRETEGRDLRGQIEKMCR